MMTTRRHPTESYSRLCALPTPWQHGVLVRAPQPTVVEAPPVGWAAGQPVSGLPAERQAAPRWRPAATPGRPPGVATRLALRLLGLCAAASCTYTILEALPAAAAAAATAAATAAGCLCLALPINHHWPTVHLYGCRCCCCCCCRWRHPPPPLMSATATARGANARNMTETASVAARPRAVGRRPCRFSPLTSSRAAQSGGMPACPPRPRVQKEYPSVERKASTRPGSVSAREPACRSAATAASVSTPRLLGSFNKLEEGQVEAPDSDSEESESNDRALRISGRVRLSHWTEIR